MSVVLVIKINTNLPKAASEKNFEPAAELWKLEWVISDYKAAYTQYELFTYGILSFIKK